MIFEENRLPFHFRKNQITHFLGSFYTKTLPIYNFTKLSCVRERERERERELMRWFRITLIN